jgi:DtxR family transcriptional regulator, manganese transport regulator
MHQEDEAVSSARAIHFQEKRKQHLLEVAEDYTELIADLIESQGKARVCDLAREMGISHVSVLKTLNKLIRDGYVIKTKQQSIELTPKGKELALFSKKKHTILFEFLHKIGVPEEIAAIDVEGIEHHISLTTLNAIESHLRKCNDLL